MDVPPARIKLATALIVLGTLLWAFGIDEVGPISTFWGVVIAVILLVRLYKAASGQLSDEVRASVNRVAIGVVCVGVVAFMVGSGLATVNPFGLVVTMSAGFGFIWVLIGAHPIR